MRCFLYFFSRGGSVLKTLIFNGSPRKNGDTAYLISVLTRHLDDEYVIVDCYNDDVSPCVDCRACRTKDGCVIGDGMQRIYEYIKSCDNVVIATPVYYSQPTGRLLDVWSRFQTFFSAGFFRHEDIGMKPKRGAIIIVGGGGGGLQPASDTAKLMLRSVNAREIYPVISSFNTDNIPAMSDKDAIDNVKHAADFLNDSGR